MSTNTKNENSSTDDKIKKYKDTKMLHIDSDIRKIQVKF